MKQSRTLQISRKCRNSVRIPFGWFYICNVASTDWLGTHVMVAEQLSVSLALGSRSRWILPVLRIHYFFHDRWKPPNNFFLGQNSNQRIWSIGHCKIRNFCSSVFLVSMLVEKNILFISKNRDRLTLCILAALSLLYPVTWYALCKLHALINLSLGFRPSIRHWLGNCYRFYSESTFSLVLLFKSYTPQSITSIFSAHRWF